VPGCRHYSYIKSQLKIYNKPRAKLPATTPKNRPKIKRIK